MSEEAKKELETLKEAVRRWARIELCLRKAVTALAEGIGKSAENGAAACLMEGENVHDLLRAVLAGDMTAYPQQTITEARNARLWTALNSRSPVTTIALSVSIDKAPPTGG